MGLTESLRPASLSLLLLLLYISVFLIVYDSTIAAAQDIEEDPTRLLSTGLFKSCRPVVFPPKRTGEFYPTFLQVRTSAYILSFNLCCCSDRTRAEPPNGVPAKAYRRVPMPTASLAALHMFPTTPNPKRPACWQPWARPVCLRMQSHVVTPYHIVLTKTPCSKAALALHVFRIRRRAP